MKCSAGQFDTKYVLFTGLPGAGKSTLIFELKKYLEDQGKSVIFRDDETERYRTVQLYWYAIFTVPFSYTWQLFKYWSKYPAPENYSFFRKWQKKLAIIKRYVTTYIILHKSKPDYFIDETIETQFRLFDEKIENVSSQLRLYEVNDLTIVFVDTDLTKAAHRQVKREVLEEKTHAEAVHMRLKNSEWYSLMQDRIRALLYSIKDQTKNFKVKTIILDGSKSVQDNFEELLKACELK